MSDVCFELRVAGLDWRLYRPGTPTRHPAQTPSGKNKSQAESVHTKTFSPAPPADRVLCSGCFSGNLGILGPKNALFKRGEMVLTFQIPLFFMTFSFNEIVDIEEWRPSQCY